MKHWIRIAQIGFSLFLAFLAVAFFLKMDWALGLWPWSDAYTGLSPLSAIFLSSILAATAAPILWIGLSGTESAGISGALNLSVSFLATAVFMFQSYFESKESRVLTAGIIMAIAFMLAVGIALYSRRIPPVRPGGVPVAVRVSFGIFVVMLVIVGGGLVLKIPRIFPWPITTEMSVVYGWLFLGAALYFLLGVLRPSWDNTAGQLVGFLAYDIVLIVPFIQHFPVVDPDLRLNLIVYILVLVYSGALAAYYLFVHSATRIIGPRQPHLA